MAMEAGGMAEKIFKIALAILMLNILQHIPRICSYFFM
jgi:hypothetical protein